MILVLSAPKDVNGLKALAQGLRASVVSSEVRDGIAYTKLSNPVLEWMPKERFHSLIAEVAEAVGLTCCWFEC